MKKTSSWTFVQLHHPNDCTLWWACRRPPDMIGAGRRGENGCRPGLMSHGGSGGALKAPGFRMRMAFANID